MALFAEHGATASEPFAVSGAYINRMTDDGSPCTRDVLAMVGDRSAALHGFLLRAQAEHLRCVEIITGVGSGQEGGILRRELPLWLSRQDLHHLVLAAVHPHPGNPGSVRVLLRRRLRGRR